MSKDFTATVNLPDVVPDGPFLYNIEDAEGIVAWVHMTNEEWKVTFETEDDLLEWCDEYGLEVI